MNNVNIFNEMGDLIPSKKQIKYCPNCGNKLENNNENYQKCDNCNYIHYINPSPAVSILIKDGNKVLLGKRNGKIKNNLWCLPCGFIDFGEDYIAAGVREVKEETGVDVKITKIINVAFNYINPNLNTVVMVLLGECTGGEIKAGDDISEVKRFDYDAFPEMAFQADSHIIEYNFTHPDKGIEVMG